MIHEKYRALKAKQDRLLKRKNIVRADFYNGIYDRYQYPVLTRDHVPLHWRYDLSKESNPYFMERLGVNAVFNAGAVFFGTASRAGKYYAPSWCFDRFLGHKKKGETDSRRLIDRVF